MLGSVIYTDGIWITRKATDLFDSGGVRGAGKVNEPVPNEDTDAEGVNGEYLRTLEAVDGVSLLAEAVTLGEGGNERVQGWFLWRLEGDESVERDLYRVSCVLTALGGLEGPGRDLKLGRSGFVCVSARKRGAMLFKCVLLTLDGKNTDSVDAQNCTTGLRRNQ